MAAEPRPDYRIGPLPGYTPAIGRLVSMLAYVRETTLEVVEGLTTPAVTSERTRLGGNLGDEARQRIRGQPLDYYLQRMHDVRARTLETLAQRDDAWLDEVHPFGNAKLANNHFKWFHVLEDELSHRGQILLIRKRLPPRATDHP